MFAIAGIGGVILAWLYGDVLLGMGLVCIAASGFLAPPGNDLDRAGRTARIAMSLSAAGVALIAADLVIVAFL